MSRKVVVMYAERVLGLSRASDMTSVQLVIATGLWSLSTPISHDNAVDLLRRTTEYDLIVKAPRPEHRQKRATPIQQKPRKQNKFYASRAWLELRYAVLQKRGAACQCCGSRGDERGLHVDHIKPFSIHPELAMDESNLQVLCHDCNIGKSNKDSTDWRIAEEYSDAAIGKLLRSIS